jgi:hypothetical protein
VIYFCCDELRRAALADPSKNSSGLNGIDFLEVLDRELPPNQKLMRQRLLELHFVNDLTGGPLTKKNVRIDGGERISDVIVTNVTPGPGTNVLTVEVNHPGDFSIYTLRLVQDAQHPQPPPGHDPVLSDVEFSFKVECPSDFDCKPRCVCPPASRTELEINYLAKDYASFRRLMLDRIALLNPQWTERSAADLGVGLVEALAFVGDYLSYQQDAIGTEAYLGTARRRVSIRRHARLVDYLIHDGCNARAWVAIKVAEGVNGLVVPGPTNDSPGTKVITQTSASPGPLREDQFTKVLNENPVIFQTMDDVTLYEAHNEMNFYTWTEERCCLPKGATSAELEGHFPKLQIGDVLIFEEVFGPRTGEAGDADPSHRQAVRLTQEPVLAVDPLNTREFTSIEWGDEDALTFPLCISSRTDKEHGEKYLGNTVSVARGNIVLCDHGLTETNAPIPEAVPKPTILRPTSDCDPCKLTEPVSVPPRYRPILKDAPLTFAAPFDATASAASALRWDVRTAVPAISLSSLLNAATATWLPKRDLLNSNPAATEFVVEIDTDGTAYLRFGDDLLAERPEAGTKFTATYRVGNGIVGNIGADSLTHVVTNLDGIASVRNPLPAQGGMDPETIEDVRQHAPAAFRTQERAVTESDYAEVTQRDRRVQRAAATFRWTGSWHTVFLTVDRLGGLLVDTDFKDSIRNSVERYRMAGYDLEADAPLFVSLQIEMHVCAKPDYFRADVQAAILELFSNQILLDGRRGLFHPDNFTFGQTVYLSPLIAAAQAVDGVQSVQVTVFQRQGQDDAKPLEAGFLPMGRLEIARCDNDPNFAERGVFLLTVGGGK